MASDIASHENSLKDTTAENHVLVRDLRWGNFFDETKRVYFVILQIDKCHYFNNFLAKDNSVEKCRAPEAELKIGDRLWFKHPDLGTVSGRIQYYGEVGVTASSLRVGLVLDAEYKIPAPAFHTNVGGRGQALNDGSYKGKRLFTCEPGRGHFRKISECSRTKAFSHGDDETLLQTSSDLVPFEDDDDGVSLCSSRAATTVSQAGGDPDIAIGDRVLVAPSRTGLLKFLGETKFSPGIWAGIELDENLGKNDGSVKGFRYFKCKHNYGLFTLAKNVRKISAGPRKFSQSGALTQVFANQSEASTPASAGPRLATERVLGQRKYSTYSSLSRVGSQESLRSECSFVSLRSNASQQRKLPNGPLSRPSLKEPQTASKIPSASMVKAAKNQEIQRWLQENRDQKDEIEKVSKMLQEKCDEISFMTNEQETFKRKMESDISDLRTQVEEFEKQNEELEARLNEEKLKTEELQFQLEEVAINKDLIVEGDLENLAMEGDTKIELAGKNAQILELRNEKEKLQTRLEVLEMEWITLNKDKEVLAGINEKLQEKMKGFTDELEDIKGKLLLVQDEREQFNLEKRQLTEKLSLTENKIQELEQTIPQSVGENAQSKSVEDLEAKYAGEICELKKQLEMSQDLVVQKLDRLNFLEESVKMHEETGRIKDEFTEQLQKTHDENVEKLSAISKRGIELESIASSKSRALESLEAQIMGKAEEIVELHARMEKLTSAHVRESFELKHRIQELELEKKTLQGDHQEKVEGLKKNFMRELEKKLGEESAKISESRAVESQFYQRQIGELETRLEEVLNRLEAKENSALEAQLALKAMTNQYNSAQTKMQELSQKLEDRSKLVEAIKADNANLQQAFAASEDRCNKAGGDMDRIKGKLIQVEAELEAVLVYKNEQAKELRKAREANEALKLNFESALDKLAIRVECNLQNGAQTSPLLQEQTAPESLPYMDKLEQYDNSGTMVRDMHRDCLQTQQFLNSVIVDMNKQLEVLHKRVSELQDAPELSPPDSTCFTPSDEDGGIIQTPAQYLAWTQTADSDKNHRPTPAAPWSKAKSYARKREYCDNCQEFDLHDTANCPRTDSEEISVPYSKKEFRLTLPFQGDSYCENCLAFGHDTYPCRYNMRAKEGRMDALPNSS